MLHTPRFALWLGPILGLILLMPPPADGQATTALRDSLRGVTLHSLQISTDPMADVQLQGGLFSDADVMTLGISALVFDDRSLDHFVFWLRHDGPRRWFTGGGPPPLTVQADDMQFRPLPMHRTRALAAGREPLTEKLEFALSPNDLAAIVNAEEVNVELNTVLGTVNKQLAPEHLTSLRRFSDRILNARSNDGAMDIASR